MSDKRIRVGFCSDFESVRPSGVKVRYLTDDHSKLQHVYPTPLPPPTRDELDRLRKKYRF